LSSIALQLDGPAALGIATWRAGGVMRIYLIGFMGSGKTTVGAALAAALGYPLVDLDAVIEERAALTVREIFEQHGEGVFRDLEHEALAATLELPEAVVATGGGTSTWVRNLQLVRQSGVSVWLNPSFATIMGRIGALGKRDRPLFRTEVEALALYRSRLEAYRQADLTLEIRPDESPEESAARIALWLRQRVCAT
jgi:shikimate kinase